MNRDPLVYITAAVFLYHVLAAGVMLQLALLAGIPGHVVDWIRRVVKT